VGRGRRKRWGADECVLWWLWVGWWVGEGEEEGGHMERGEGGWEVREGGWRQKRGRRHEGGEREGQGKRGGGTEGSLAGRSKLFFLLS